MPAGLNVKICFAGVSKGKISAFTPRSRTRRAIKCANWLPKLSTTIIVYCNICCVSGSTRHGERDSLLHRSRVRDTRSADRLPRGSSENRKPLGGGRHAPRRARSPRIQEGDRESVPIPRNWRENAPTRVS